MLKEQPGLVLRHGLRLLQELCGTHVHMLVHGRTLHRRCRPVVDKNFAADLLEELVGDLRSVDHLDLRIGSKMDSELLEGLDATVALAVAADHGALAPADRAADLAVETGTMVAHLNRLHDRVAGGVRDATHLGARAVPRSVAPGTVDLARSEARRV